MGRWGKRSCNLILYIFLESQPDSYYVSRFLVSLTSLYQCDIYIICPGWVSRLLWDSLQSWINFEYEMLILSVINSQYVNYNIEIWIYVSLLFTNMFIVMIPVYCALQVQLSVVTIKKWTILFSHKTILVNHIALRKTL